MKELVLQIGIKNLCKAYAGLARFLNDMKELILQTRIRPLARPMLALCDFSPIWKNLKLESGTWLGLCWPRQVDGWYEWTLTTNKNQEPAKAGYWNERTNTGDLTKASLSRDVEDWDAEMSIKVGWLIDWGWLLNWLIDRYFNQISWQWSIRSQQKLTCGLLGSFSTRLSSMVSFLFKR